MNRNWVYSLFALWIVCSFACMQPKPVANVEVQKENFVFSIKGTDTLSLDKYELTSMSPASKKPVMIFAFGGGFKGGDKADKGYIPYFEFLARNGFVVVSTDYRTTLKNLDPSKVSSPMYFIAALQHAIDTAVEDFYDATGFVINQSSDWNIDVEQIVASGSSAGAITVLQAEYDLCNGHELAKRLPAGFNYAGVISYAGALDRIVSFMNTTENPPVERLLIPDMALTAAEYFAVNNNEKVLVLLTDMTSYADALAIVSNRMDQIPSKDSMPGSLYSDLAKIYEKAVQFPSGGSITIIAVTTLSGGDITHAVPDNTGYITEGQLFLRRDSDIGKVIVDPFRSLSRLKQLVTGKKTRKDHPQVMNAAVRLYADAANAKTKLENGFDLTNYDERTLAFAKDYSNQLLAIDVNLDTTEMLDVAWSLFGKYFRPEEVNIKKELVDQFWPKAN